MNGKPSTARFLFGMAAGFVAMVPINAIAAAFVVAIADTVFAERNYLPPAIGLAIGFWQWLYVVPLFLAARRIQWNGLATGLLIGGAVTLLLICPCFGLFMVDDIQRKYAAYENRPTDLPGAISGGYTALENVQRFLDQGADPNARDAQGRSALRLALDKGWDTAGVLLLQRGASPKEPGSLERAARQRMPDTFALLVEKGADVKERDPEGHTLLDAAAAGQQYGLLRELAGRGLDPKEADPKTGRTVLHRAMDLEHPDPNVVDALVAAGADPNARDGDGATPLHLAAARDNSPALEALLARGADADARDAQGRTPLAVAAASCRAPNARVLVSHGAAAAAVPAAVRTPEGLAAACKVDEGQDWERREAREHVLELQKLLEGK